MDKFSYVLPSSNTQPQKCETDNNSVIIIGANGSGKSRLGAWMEKNDEENIHRIGAQRILSFQKYITLTSLEQADNRLFYGTDTKQDNHMQRWGYDGENYNYFSLPLNDYEHVLSALLAKNRKEEHDYVEKCRLAEKHEERKPNIPVMVIDKLKSIWNTVFPQCEVDIKDSKVVSRNSYSSVEYHGKNMSDGERVVLYLIGQILCVPENKTIIIDEPELHIHSSIMNKLWITLEQERKDCLFIYITHDTTFAANHPLADKIWIKKYDGNNWEFEKIKNSDIPEELLLNIMGNRKNVLFVEGVYNSLDYRLYNAIYKDVYVVPCGSCEKVISMVKAMKDNQQLHHLKCYGIIDRDYRSEYEINKIKELEDIFVLELAEVENLFITEGILRIVMEITQKEQNVIDSIKAYILDRYSNSKQTQINKAITVNIKHLFCTTDINHYTNINSICDSLKLNVQNIIYEIKSMYDNATGYDYILKIFNEKTLVGSIGYNFGLSNNAYCDLIIRHLNNDKSPYKQKLLNAFCNYLPNIEHADDTTV